MDDTGFNVPESKDTLLLQQKRLLSGKRAVQMFPTGTTELELPDGMWRITNHRGVFHYNPEKITPEDILYLSDRGHENEFLELGPYSKPEIQQRVALGEVPSVVIECTPTGVEVRTALGTTHTMNRQKDYFERTKEQGNQVYCGSWPQRVHSVLKENQYGR